MYPRSCFTLNPATHIGDENDQTGYTKCCATRIHCIPGNHTITKDHTEVNCTGKLIPYYVLLDGRDALKAGLPEEKKFIRDLNAPVTVEEFVAFLRRVPESSCAVEMLWLNPIPGDDVTTVTYEIFDEMNESRDLSGAPVGAGEMSEELEERLGDDPDLFYSIVHVSNTEGSFVLTRKKMFRIMYQILVQSSVESLSFIPENQLSFREGYVRFLEEMQYPVVSDGPFTRLMYAGKG